MPIELKEKKLLFTFPGEWNASKFDEWSFFKNQFAKLSQADWHCSECKATLHCAECGKKKPAGTNGVDFLAIEPGSEPICWHIEVKDYRTTRESNFAFLADAVALKVRGTLACLVAAQVNGNDDKEKKAAKLAVLSSRHRIVLHLEQPTARRPLYSPKKQRADILNKLKQLVKFIDPHPLVLDMGTLEKVGWTVAQVGPPPS